MDGRLDRPRQHAPATPSSTRFVDPEAAEIVFASGVPLTMVGLNLTHQAQATPEVIERLRARRHPGRRGDGRLAVASSPTPTARSSGSPARRYTTRARWRCCIDPSLVRSVEAFVAIETEGRWTRGATVVDLHGRLGEPPERARRDGARRRRASGTSSSARSRRCDRGRRLDQPRPRGRRRAPPGAGRDRRRRRLPAAAGRQGRQPGGRRGAAGERGGDGRARRRRRAGRAAARGPARDEGVDVEHVREDATRPAAWP